MIHEKIDSGKAFDWGRASADYAKYRDIYPPEFYEKILSLGCCVKGQKVLDIGTGTGVLPRNLYKYGADFTAADISENQIAYAKKLSAGMDIEYIVSPAEDLKFSDDTFDVVTACQCFMYFDRNILFPKAHDFLKEKGHFLILQMEWLPYEDEIAGKSEELILKYNPMWSGGGYQKGKVSCPPGAEKYFELSYAGGFDVSVHFTRESWNGRIKACRGIDASLPKAQISEFEKEHLKMLGGYPPEFDILHHITIIDLMKT